MIPLTDDLRATMAANLARHERTEIALEGRRHAAVAILVVDSHVGSDADDPHQATQEDMSVIPSDTTGLDGRMAGVAGGASFVLCRRSAGLNSHASQWALPPADALMRQALTAALLQRGLRPPEPVVESLSAITMRWLVRFDTDLLGVMRLHQAREERAMGLLQILPVRPTIALPDISMITCRDTVDVANGAAVLMTALRQAGRRRDLLQPVAARR